MVLTKGYCFKYKLNPFINKQLMDNVRFKKMTYRPMSERGQGHTSICQVVRKVLPKVVLSPAIM